MPLRLQGVGLAQAGLAWYAGTNGQQRSSSKSPTCRQRLLSWAATTCLPCSYYCLVQIAQRAVAVVQSWLL